MGGKQILCFWVDDLISRVIVHENVISAYQHLSLGVDNQKQIRFRKLKMLLLFNGSLNTAIFFYHPIQLSKWSVDV